MKWQNIKLIAIIKYTFSFEHVDGKAVNSLVNLISQVMHILTSDTYTGKWSQLLMSTQNIKIHLIQGMSYQLRSTNNH